MESPAGMSREVPVRDGRWDEPTGASVRDGRWDEPTGASGERWSAGISLEAPDGAMHAHACLLACNVRWDTTHIVPLSSSAVMNASASYGGGISVGPMLGSCEMVREIGICMQALAFLIARQLPAHSPNTRCPWTRASCPIHTTLISTMTALPPMYLSRISAPLHARRLPLKKAFSFCPLLS